MVRDGLVMQLDAANPKSFRGNTNNLCGSINKVYGNWGINNGYSEYFLAPNGSQGVHLNISSYTDGGVNFYANNYISVLPNTNYTISLIYKADFIPHGNLMYNVQYDLNNVYIGEGGSFNSSRQISLGNGWYTAWGSFTTLSNCYYIRLHGFEYKVNNIWVYDLRLEQNGNTIYDLSKNNNYGTLINGVDNNTDNCGSFVFDGSDDVISVKDSSNISFSGDDTYTLSAWVKPTISSTTWYGVFSKGNENSYAMNINTIDWHLEFEVYGSTVVSRAFSTTSNVVIPNVWNHIVMVFDGNSQKIYVNNILINSRTTTLGTISNTSNLRIGLGNDGEYFKGYMSDIKIYNRALSQSEITQNFNATKGRFGI